MTARTLSLAEVATMVCDNELKNPELWLLRKVRSGKVSALKISRGHYRFTAEQVDALLAQMDTANSVEEVAPQQKPGGLAPGSARRLRSAS